MTRCAPPVLILAKRDPHREATGFVSLRRVGWRNRCGVKKGQEKQRRSWSKPTGAPWPPTRIGPETAGEKTDWSAGEKTNRKESSSEKAEAA